MSSDQRESPRLLVLAPGTTPRAEPRASRAPEGVSEGTGAARTGVRRTTASVGPGRSTRGDQLGAEQATSRDDCRQPETEDRVGKGTRYLLIAFAVFTLLAVNQLLILGRQTDTFFAWTIRSRPNATFLGAAYGAGFVLSVLALRQRQWSRVRLAVATVTAFTILTLIPSVWHMHRLHLMADAMMARSAAWVWLAVYVLVPVACLVVVVRQERLRRPQEGVPERMPAWLVAILLTQGAALATAGAVLWIGGARSHAMMEVMRAPWPWPVTPLTSQVLGAWLLSFAFGIGLSIHQRDLSPMLVPAVAYAAFGMFAVLVLLTFRTTTGTDTGWLLIDVAVMATLVPTGAYGWWSAHHAAGGEPVVKADA